MGADRISPKAFTQEEKTDRRRTLVALRTWPVRRLETAKAGLAGIYTGGSSEATKSPTCSAVRDRGFGDQPSRR